MRHNLIAIVSNGINIGEKIDLGTGKSINATFPSIGTLFNLLLKNSITIAGVILLGLLIFGGLKFIMSAGSNDAKKAAEAKTIITDAIIGFAVVFCAYFIVQIIQLITGVSILNPGI